MAKFVIAGKADCPFYAKAELLADQLMLNLPSFEVHKIVKRPEEWEGWLSETCDQRNWKHKGSPLIWRELVDRGGKGILLGGCDDFLEMASGYYGLNSTKMSEELLNIANENFQTKIELDEEEEERKRQINPMKICVTGASSAVAYGILSHIAQGDIFGLDQEVSINLLDSVENQEVLNGVAMEIQDSAWPLLRGVQFTSDPEVAFKDVSLAVLLDEVTPSEDRQEFLKANARIFKAHGLALEGHASKNVKVLVAGNMAAVNAFVVSKFAPSVPKQNLCASSRLEETRAKGLLAKNLNVNTASVQDVIVWGSTGQDHFIDTRIARVHGYDGAIWGPHVPGFTRSVPEMVHNEKWLTTEFPEALKNRPVELRQHRDTPTALSASAAVSTLLQDWWQGVPSKMWSLGVTSEGWYGIPEGVVFSFPVKFAGDCSWRVVEDLQCSDSLTKALESMGKELKTSCDEALASLEWSDEVIFFIIYRLKCLCRLFQ